MSNASLEAQLDEAVGRNDLEKVKALISKGADIEHRDPFGNTALMSAAWSACTEVLAYLIDIGAVLNNKDNEGKTALQQAKSIGHNKYGHDKVIQLLENALNKHATG